jgi:hypothetical protein
MQLKPREARWSPPNREIPQNIGKVIVEYDIHLRIMHPKIRAAPESDIVRILLDRGIARRIFHFGIFQSWGGEILIDF